MAVKETMKEHLKSDRVEFLIIGQGLAGSAVAWALHRKKRSFAVVDDPKTETASRVSAGLVTPVTGKRLVKSDDYDSYWRDAVEFYRSVEDATQTSLFEERPMVRLFPDKQSREEYLRDTDVTEKNDVELWSGTVQNDGKLQHGFRMRQAGRLRVAEYLKRTERYFSDRDQIYHRDVDVAGMMKIITETPSAEEYRIPELQFCFQHVIFCTGSWITDAFPTTPNNPSRGDILEVKIENYDMQDVVHRSVWIAPEENSRQLIGSTYDWKFLENKPSQHGRNQVLTGVRRIVSGDIRLLKHRAAVRPTMKDYQPVVGSHSEHQRIHILNGLGSKGALRAPRLATVLVDHIVANGNLPQEWRVSRLATTKPSRRRPLTALAQEEVAKTLAAGDWAIDATVGNGFDTTFLANTVGSDGVVTGYDIQQKALHATRQRLEAASLNNVDLRHQGHEQLAEDSVDRPLKAVMFNLGYLPRSDRNQITTAATSRIAIEAALDKLADDGVITVLCYRGHDGGPEEYEAVEHLLSAKIAGYHLTRHDSDPPKPTSPVLFVIRKRADHDSQ